MRLGYETVVPLLGPVEREREREREGLELGGGKGKSAVGTHSELAGGDLEFSVLRSRLELEASRTQRKGNENRDDGER